MFNIIHTADWHIGDSQHILGDEAFLRSKKMLYAIKQVALENSVKIVVIAGDVFHKNRPAQKEKDLFIKWLRDMDSHKVFVIITSGNHDYYSDFENALDTAFLLQKTKLPYVRVVIKEPELISISELKISFACIPWNFNIEENLENLFKKVPKSFKFVGVGHLPLPGITTDSDYFIKGSHNLLKTKFVVWLGDVHKRYISPCGHLQMCGAPMQHNWADKLPKGISLIKSDVLTSPHLLKLNVPKFVVTKDIVLAKEEAAKGNIVKLISVKPIDEELSENIVEVSNFMDETEAIDYESDFNILEGLPTFLAEKGLDELGQKSALRLIEKIVKTEISL